ncbi:alpha/beta fold hydrolase [Azospirillum sp. A29]|uniref:alpha/beta fold hydrolase n=1 Tax=unclassified Azospirillum TaxID=2630922 RepID=UPI00366DE188
MFIVARNNVKISGQGTRTIMFAHGFGCNQHMWRFVTPAFEDHYRIVTFDHVGAGRSDLSAYDYAKYASLDGYASDVVEIAREFDVKNGVFVGHSVSAMIGVLAVARDPILFSRLMLIGPSPCYIDDGDYVGGFSKAQINDLLDFLGSNHMGWSRTMAPGIMGNPDKPALGEELANSFCRTDPEIAKHFARTTFLSDNRKDLGGVVIPSLILQCSEDIIAPEAVGRYVHTHLANSTLVLMSATGHCPNLSAPHETIDAIECFLACS